MMVRGWLSDGLGWLDGCPGVARWWSSGSSGGSVIVCGGLVVTQQ
jgi:hypothetical protein